MLRPDIAVFYSFIAQSIACAEASVKIMSSFVERILDWHKKCPKRIWSIKRDPDVKFVVNILDIRLSLEIVKKHPIKFLHSKFHHKLCAHYHTTATVLISTTSLLRSLPFISPIIRLLNKFIYDPVILQSVFTLIIPLPIAAYFLTEDQRYGKYV